MPLILTPRKVKTFRRLCLERVKAGRFFNVTCVFGHVLELSGVDLCYRLAGLGENIWCTECLKRAQVRSIAEGRLMSEQEKEKQEKDYLEWKDEWERLGWKMGNG
jgi:hypothetical protein